MTYFEGTLEDYLKFFRLTAIHTEAPGNGKAERMSWWTIKKDQKDYKDHRQTKCFPEVKYKGLAQTYSIGTTEWRIKPGDEYKKNAVKYGGLYE